MAQKARVDGEGPGCGIHAGDVLRVEDLFEGQLDAVVPVVVVEMLSYDGVWLHCKVLVYLVVVVWLLVCGCLCVAVCGCLCVYMWLFVCVYVVVCVIKIHTTTPPTTPSKCHSHNHQEGTNLRHIHVIDEVYEFLSTTGPIIFTSLLFQRFFENFLQNFRRSVEVERDVCHGVIFAQLLQLGVHDHRLARTSITHQHHWALDLHQHVQEKTYSGGFVGVHQHRLLGVKIDVCVVVVGCLCGGGWMFVWWWLDVCVVVV